MSLCRMITSLERFRDAGTIMVKMDQECITWIEGLMTFCSFGKTPNTKFVHIPLIYPYLWVDPDLAFRNGHLPTILSDLPSYYLRLIRACRELRQLEVEIFH
jgi:hypothetical protein